MNTVRDQIEAQTLEKYDDALRSGNTDWLNQFWNDVADSTGYDKQQIINSLLDEYNNDEIQKAALDYYMSTLAEWPGPQD
jgi:hypothetical protein